ncbi:testis-specific serine/threonine-protein kinase 1-like [Oppia nitens]|uniref:testis-specific serine/threonine-protein kinase 1-like n=1 Tax=Oppia nitens TaxID=1686743 RepID=UPI0023DA9EDA|nr:testis-specific serine/threonine-protein kinase 1-like [Oppia nitens]XP_054155568.1 testis-specific serine/threonine-protein kinase 1-like [Oppia nitens]
MSSNISVSHEGLKVLSKRGYKNFAKLDSGGQGNVYKTSKNDIQYACKVIKVDNQTKDGKMDDDSKREISILKNLKHCNCITIVDLFRTKHKVYIMMDFMPNGTIGSYVRHNDGISEWQAKCWFCPIARAVRYLHQHRVAHRDIKLDNILLDKHWNPVLTDFGFSRFVNIGRDNIVDLSNTYCGTPSHNPPEIVNKRHYDPFKADVWCLGVSLYIMINKDYPFEKKDRRKMYDQQLKRQYKLRNEVTNVITEDLKNLIHQLLEPIPKKRIDIDNVCRHPWFPIDSIDSQYAQQIDRN